MLGDIQQPRWLYFKAILLLCVGLLASAEVISQLPSWWDVGVLAVAVWGFCRAYYFAFYVVQHYADPQYKFAGLVSFGRYVLDRHRRAQRKDQKQSATVL